MNQQGPLRWIEGTGWLVFSSGSPDSDIRSQVLARAGGDGVVAYVSFADDRGDALMDDMEDLGAPSGYLIDFAVDRGPILQKQLEHVSLVVIETGSSLNALLEMLVEEVITPLRQTYERGAVILIEGVAINAFGRWTVTDDGEAVDGLNWVENVFLEPTEPDAEQSLIRDVLEAYDDAIGIAIGEGAALVLGGTGTVEVWGQANVKVSLGRQYSQ